MAERNMPSYLEGNSKNGSPGDRHVKAPVKGSISVKRPPMTKKMKSAMLAEDLEEVKSYLFWDILIPTVKDTIVSLIKNGVEALFYGDSGGYRRKGDTSYSSQSRASYAGYYSAKAGVGDRPKSFKASRTRTSPYGLADILFTGVDGEGGLDAKRQAEEVLDQLVELTMSYGCARVAEYYELSGYPSDFTDNKYGWGELSEARILRAPGGYVIDLPKPEPLVS